MPERRTTVYLLLEKIDSSRAEKGAKIHTEQCVGSVTSHQRTHEELLPVYNKRTEL